MQDIREYEKTQESLAMLRILARSGKNLKEGRVRPSRDAFRPASEKIGELEQAQDGIASF